MILFMTNRIDSFEIEMDEIDGSTAEMEVCKRCGIGWPNSSDLNQFWNGSSQKVNIFATEGKASCWLSAYKKAKTEIYVITVSSITFSRKKQ